MAVVLNYLTRLFNSEKPNAQERFLSFSKDVADLERRTKELIHSTKIPTYRYWI